ncbi:MAG: alpha/beta hydrolase [Lachnospiraceae bacterium]|nr:alpha/beta hydrolase [Robinsoniella sp.]MDY3765116.1 alpha/beta hydrolase [Lachnospiraceae bacterium]
MKKVFVHGLGQVSDSWKKVISFMEEPDQCVCTDLVLMLQGKEVSYQNLYEAFADFCDENEEPLDLCGLSLGGVLCLNYAVEHPEKVRSLVLIAAQYKMPKKLLQFQNILFRLMPESMFQQMGFGKKEFIKLCKTMMNLDFGDSLEKIICPVMVLCGERDRANKKESAKLADLLRDAEFEVIDGAGHEVNIDTPDKLAKILGNFYGRVNGQRMRSITVRSGFR